MSYTRKEFWGDADVKCPFYISDNKAEKSVSCEGFGESMRATFKFSSLQQRERHMGVYCVNRFETCPMYRCTYNCKYREDG